MWLRAVLVFIVFTFVARVSAQPVADSLEIAPDQLWFTSHDTPVYIPYKTSATFEGQQLPEVTRALVAFHTVGRDAVGMYSTVGQVVVTSQATDYTLLVCPQLMNPGQVLINPWMDHGVLAWGTDWFFNGLSVNPDLPPTRSFVAIDSLADAIVAACPNLEVLVFTGHAGGGKFVHRFAMVSTVQERHPDIQMLYQFGNSGGYTYLTPERFDPDLYDFVTPASGLDTTGCAKYDYWPFGMSNVPQPQKQQLRQRYQQQNIVMMVGMRDTGLRNPNCQMLFQAPDASRLQMANLYWAHTERVYGEIPPTHLYFPLPGVPHAAAPFYEDLETRHILLFFLQDHKVYTAPVESPVTVPPSGGDIAYQVYLFNSWYDSLDVDIWTELVLPDQTTMGPLQQTSMTLDPGVALQLPGELTASIPANAPAGDYLHVTNMGVYPGIVYASSSFPFTKLASE